MMGPGETHLLVLDTGDAMLDGTLGDMTRGKVIVAGMSQMGYDAMALGAKDLQLGEATLRQRIAEATFPVVSANVSDDHGAAFTEPYVVLEVGDHRVGVIGLTAPPQTPATGFTVGDPATALGAVLDEVHQHSHTVVLLTDIGLDNARQIARETRGLDLVIAANPITTPLKAERLPETGALLVSAEHPVSAHSGRRVGRLTATLDETGRLTNETWESVWMDKSIPDDPDMAKLIDAYQTGAQQ